MVPVYLNISNQAKRKINKNVNCMFDFLLAICDGLCYEEVLQDIFAYVNRKIGQPLIEN